MKKIVLVLTVILTSTQLLADEMEFKRWFTALTAGYVFKHGCEFENVYGKGITNIITADGCYFPWEHWGFGAKVSYWRAKGKTAFLQQCTLLQQVPFIVYVRARKEFACRLQLYGSLGGGFTWVKETSYLPTERFIKGLGEIEVGVNYPIWRCINLVAAVRYLFPPQKQCGESVDFGGVDVRAGIGFTF
jgi:hypothetical protein